MALALDDINPFDPQVMADPWDYYRQLREEAPVYRHPLTGLYMISSHALVSEAVKDHQTFSNRFAVAMGGASDRVAEEARDLAKEGYPIVDTMLTADPPEHHRYRGLVNKAFSLRRVKALQEEITGIAHELVDGFAGDGQVELLSRFAQPLPLTVIAGQLGAPRADLPKFREWTDGFVAQLSGMASPEEQVEAQRLILEFQRYFADILEARRAEPKDDIISDIVHARLEGERPLDTGESLSILQQLLVAGNETTASAIAEGMWLLCCNPDQMARVLEDEAHLPGLVEEVLRLATPTGNMWRVTTRDVELGGVSIPARSMVILRFAAANRDPEVFADPERMDVTRPNLDEHLAFGRGIHFCLGAMLARKEMHLAFRTLLHGRLGGWRLAEGFVPRHNPNMLLWGLDGLELCFEAR